MIPAHIATAVQHHWWLFLLRGIAALAFGVLTLAWPGATLLVLMAFIAAYALVDGIVALVYAFRLRAMFDRWWVLLVQGLISGSFGVLAFIYPTVSLAWRLRRTTPVLALSRSASPRKKMWSQFQR